MSKDINMFVHILIQAYSKATTTHRSTHKHQHIKCTHKVIDNSLRAGFIKHEEQICIAYENFSNEISKRRE